MVAAVAPRRARTVGKRSSACSVKALAGSFLMPSAAGAFSTQAVAKPLLIIMLASMRSVAKSPLELLPVAAQPPMTNLPSAGSYSALALCQPGATVNAKRPLLPIRETSRPLVVNCVAAKW